MGVQEFRKHLERLENTAIRKGILTPESLDGSKENLYALTQTLAGVYGAVEYTGYSIRLQGTEWGESTGVSPKDAILKVVFNAYLEYKDMRRKVYIDDYLRDKEWVEQGCSKLTNTGVDGEGIFTIIEGSISNDSTYEVEDYGVNGSSETAEVASTPSDINLGALTVVDYTEDTQPETTENTVTTKFTYQPGYILHGVGGWDYYPVITKGGEKDPFSYSDPEEEIDLGEYINEIIVDQPLECIVSKDEYGWDIYTTTYNKSTVPPLVNGEPRVLHETVNFENGYQTTYPGYILKGDNDGWDIYKAVVPTAVIHTQPGVDALDCVTGVTSGGWDNYKTVVPVRPVNTNSKNTDIKDEDYEHLKSESTVSGKVQLPCIIGSKDGWDEYKVVSNTFEKEGVGGLSHIIGVTSDGYDIYATKSNFIKNTKGVDGDGWDIYPTKVTSKEASQTATKSAERLVKTSTTSKELESTGNSLLAVDSNSSRLSQLEARVSALENPEPVRTVDTAMEESIVKVARHVPFFGRRL